MRIEQVPPVTPRLGIPSRQHHTGSGVELTLSSDHRDAIYDFLLDRLGEFNALRSAYEREDDPDLETCRRVGRRVSDGLRLIQDAGIGWGDSLDRDAVELRLPAGDLIQLFERLRVDILSDVEVARAEDRAGDGHRDRNERALRACEEALQRLRMMGPSS